MSTSNINNPIYGLVLCGGKSTRMGKDKCDIDYHGMPQGAYLYRELTSLCEATYLSVRADQDQGWIRQYPLIRDQDQYRGPFNGLLSAHAAHPGAAWLVVACDLPMVHREMLQALIRERDPNRVATAFASRQSRLPEPLIALWEPHGLSAAMTYLQDAESSCPRKFLIRSEAALVTPEDDIVLMNANSPEEKERALKQISS